MLSNHDRPRLAGRHGPAGVRIGLLLLLTLRGTPTLYYGDELGLADLDLPRSAWRDPLGRDQARAPMPWTSGRYGGFGPPEGAAPWLPLPVEADVESQLADPDSTLNLTRRLLALRRGREELRSGTYRTLHGLPDDCLGYLRTSRGRTTATLINFGHDRAGVRLPGAELLLSTAPRRRQTEELGAVVPLSAREGVLLDLGTPRSVDS